MGKSITKSTVGRPTKLNDDLVVKLESIFKIGGTVEEACSYALINKTTYYRWLEENKDFATKMNSAQHYADIMAKKVVVRSILQDENLESAKYWLDRRAFKNPTQTNIQVNVQPLLGGESVKNVPGNYSNKENPATE